MSSTKTTPRFIRAGAYVIDRQENRRASFASDEEAQFTADFMRTATYKQIEAYIWEAVA